MKTCTKCGQSKPLNAFNRESRASDGRRADCRACVNARKRANFGANREAITTRNRLWHQTNRAQVLARQKAYRAANQEHKSTYDRAYRQSVAGSANRRAAKVRRERMLASAKSEPYTREEIFERDAWVCQLCGEPIDATIRYADDRSQCATIDHIVPLSRGGDDTPANVQAAHGSCNFSKCDRVEVEDAEQVAS